MVDGQIITANANVLDALGYELSEVIGRHHRLFVDPAESQSAAYGEFWAKLRRGARTGAAFGGGGQGNQGADLDVTRPGRAWGRVRRRSRRALEEIVVKVGEINAHVAGIVESARSQAVGLAEIAVAVSTLDKSTWQNAAMVEESTAGISELASGARALSELLQAFKIGDARSAPALDSRSGSPAHAPTGRVVAAFGRASASGR